VEEDMVEGGLSGSGWLKGVDVVSQGICVKVKVKMKVRLRLRLRLLL
jgi:hypothetical protein